MIQYTRRRVIRDLALATGALSTGFLWPYRALANARRHRASASTSLYILVQGPWLFSVDSANNQIVARTTDHSTASGPEHHSYTYIDFVPGNEKTFQAGDTAQITVAPYPHSLPPFDKLLQAMQQSSQGLFYTSGKTGVRLADTLPTNLRVITLPKPDQILSAGLLNGVRFTLNGATTNNTVSAWPTVLAFVYDSWTQATFSTKDGSFTETISPSAIGPVFRKFDILRKPDCGPDECTAAKEDSYHAQMYFNSLMDLLVFPTGASRPVLDLHPCVPPSITVTKGGDDNIQLKHLGSLPCYMRKGLSQHNSKRSQYLFGGTLVNCASGGGGITNCC